MYSLNLKEENLSMKLTGSLKTNTRFHAVSWGRQAQGGGGVVACAGDNGGIYVYNGQELMTGGSNPLLVAMEGKHAGPALALDLNLHQVMLVKSLSVEPGLYIYIYISQKLINMEDNY